jgi:hypothetical protein
VIAASGALLMSGVVSLRGFIVLRVLGWALGGGLAAFLLSTYGAGLEARRSSESLALGLLAGAVAGTIFGLPGPSELWQAVACLAWGAGVGMAACGPLLWHANAIVEAAPARRSPGILALREWPVDERRPVALGTSRLAWQGGRLALHPGATGASVGGKPVTAAMYVAEGPLALDGSNYSVRVQGSQ